jgi:hypothetical protein
MLNQRASNLRTIGLVAISLAGTILLSGCALNGGSGSTGNTATAPLKAASIGGMLHGGQQPVNGATMILWAAGTSGYGTGATNVASTTTLSDGSFSFNNSSGVSPCTTGQYLYVTATGGNAGAGTNDSIALMAVLPTPCGTATGGTYVWVNEVTTVAAVTALQQFMKINTSATAPYTGTGTVPWTIGAPSTNTTGLANAFLQTANLAFIATGTSGNSFPVNTINSQVFTTTVTPDSSKIYGLANILAICVNDSTGNLCTGSQGVLTLTTIATGTTTPTYTIPVDTIQAAYNMATLPNASLYSSSGSKNYWKNSTSSTTYLSTLWANISSTSPFQPYTATAPPDTAIGVSWRCAGATNGTIGTVYASSVAIDGNGNIWTGGGSGVGSNVLNQFNQSAQILQTISTANLPSYTFNYYADSTTDNTGTVTANATQTLGYARPIYGVAIDTANNAWFNAYGATSPGTIATATTGILAKLTQGGTATAYITGAANGSMVFDGSNNLFMSNAPAASRWYLSMLSAAGSYQTLYEGIGRATGLYNGAAVDSNGYVWAFYATCADGQTIQRINAASILTTTGTSTADVVMPSTACAAYGAGDANGNMWTTDGANLDYTSISASLNATVNVAFTGGASTGLYNPYGMAIDGSNNVWVVNKGTNTTYAGVAEFATNGTTGTATQLSPGSSTVAGFGGDVSSYLGAPENIVLDSSGNVWFATTAGSYLYYVVGIASPTITPLASMYAHIGTKP